MKRQPKPPPPIRTDSSNAFANNTMRARLPAIIDETIALNPDYAPPLQARLRQLRDEIAAGTLIDQIDLAPTGDRDAWEAALQRQWAIVGGTPGWHNAEWFFAETYAYRRLIEATRWHESGRDPFLPKKLEELHGAALWRFLEEALAPGEAEEELRRLVELDLWANRIDLSYAASLERGTEIHAEDLLVDDRDALIRSLRGTAAESGALWGGQPSYIVADNAGSELALDLALSDCLLRHVAPSVVLCLKAHPTFVSDATPADVWLMLDEMGRRGGAIAALGGRLRAAWTAGRLRFLPHPYWNSSLFLWDLPANLAAQFQDAQLVVIKGDANYRRSVGDCLWPVDTPFSQVLSYLDAPALCLRTLKSDPVLGLPSLELAARLDQCEPAWRVNGKRGLIQFKP